MGTMPPITYGHCANCEHVIFRGTLCGLCAEREDKQDLSRARRLMASRSMIRPSALAPTPISASKREGA